MPWLEELKALLSGAAAFCIPDMIQGYWQTLLHPVVRELFTTVINDDLYTPDRMPQNHAVSKLTHLLTLASGHWGATMKRGSCV